MRCVVINLERATGRRAVVAEQFRSLGLEFEILKATDWQDLDDGDWALVDTEQRHREGRRPIPRGAIACQISHRRALESIANGPDRMVAVFEDDVTLSGNLADVFAVVHRSHLEFDVLFLHRLKPADRFVALSALSGKYRAGIVRYSDYGTQSYIITREAARRYLHRFPGITYRTDHSLHGYWVNDLRTFSIDPPVVFHGNASGHHSFLHEGGKLKRHLSILSFARRVNSLVREEFHKRRVFRRRISCES